MASFSTAATANSSFIATSARSSVASSSSAFDIYSRDYTDNNNNSNNNNRSFDYETDTTMSQNNAKLPPPPPPQSSYVNNLKSAPNNNNNNNNGNTTSTGLSELSKQLRRLHATNQSQSAEIDQLKRKLRIMTDLKGLSVSDLKNALIQSCQGEAHGELLSEIEILRAQLDAANAKIDSTTSSNNAAADFEKEASNKAIANLELRVGELEEIEIALRNEISSLYQLLEKESNTAAQLQAQLKEQEQINEDLKNREKQVTPKNPFLENGGESKNENQVQPQYKNPPAVSSSSSSSVDNNTKDKEEIKHLQKLLQKTATQLLVQQNHNKLLQTQIDSRTKELNLRHDQYNSRHTLQRERIRDLEQQMSSLYTAVDVLNEDFSGEKKKSVDVLRERLCDADEEMARKLCMEEEQKKNNNGDNNSSGGGGGGGGGGEVSALLGSTSFESSSSSNCGDIMKSLPPSSPLTTNKPSFTFKDKEEEEDYYRSNYVEATIASSPPPPISPPVSAAAAAAAAAAATATFSPSPSLSSSTATLNIKASGYLYKKDRSKLRKVTSSKIMSNNGGGGGGWKKRYFVLHQTKNNAFSFQLSYGDHSGHSIRSKYGGTIITGISTVERVDDIPKYPFAFAVHTDPSSTSSSSNSGPLYLAAEDRREMNGWLSALFEVTAGKGTELERALKESLEQEEEEKGEDAIITGGDNSSSSYANDFAFERALQESIRHQSGATFVDLEDTCSEHSSNDGEVENYESYENYNYYSGEEREEEERRKRNSLSKGSSKIFGRKSLLKKGSSRRSKR